MPEMNCDLCIANAGKIFYFSDVPCTSYPSPRSSKQRLCPGNTKRWFRQFLCLKMAIFSLASAHRGANRGYPEFRPEPPAIGERVDV